MTLLGEIERAQLGDDDGVLRLITAGSVDDGKSTLIGRLLHDCQAILEDQLAAVARASSRRGQGDLDLSLLTDGLEAEREQGITIDVAYRYFATPRRKFILADAPGHEQYTRNMVTGASTADVAVILIDARKGVLTQTRRHTYLAHLLGLRHVFVAVNKMDLVDYAQARFDAIADDFRAFAASLAIPDLRIFPISALRGDAVVEHGDGMPWYGGPTLLAALEGIRLHEEADAAPMRFPVQLVIRGDGGDFRGYGGRVVSGVLRPGDEVLILPVGRRATVRDILGHEGARDSATAEESVTVRLTEDIDVARGDLLADPARPPRIASELEATLCWLDERPMQRNGKYLLKHGTRTVPARIADLVTKTNIETLVQGRAEQPFAMNDIGRARLKLPQAIAVDPYSENRATGSFILIDPATHHTVAAGMID